VTSLAGNDVPHRRWLALCGSLRSASLHRQLLRACAPCMPDGVELVLHGSVGELPPFSPDLDETTQPAVVTLRAAVNASEALLIASPEYAHGIAGMMKNALDWMVGNESFVAKPVLIVSASARARAAPDALREVLTTMSARVAPAELTVPLLGSPRRDDEALSRDEVYLGTIRRGIQEFDEFIRQCSLELVKDQ
jgi:chromate reductase